MTLIVAPGGSLRFSNDSLLRLLERANFRLQIAVAVTIHFAASFGF